MRWAGMKARLERLERKSRVRTVPRIVLAVYDCDIGTVLGFNVDGHDVLRAPNESAAACRDRCFAMPGTRLAITAIHP